MAEIETVLTIDELSRYLKVGKTTLYRMAQEKQIPGHRIGKHWRFHREAIDRWLQDGGVRESSAESNLEGDEKIN